MEAVSRISLGSKFTVKRWVSIVVLTGVLILIIRFLFHTSENSSWGGGLWEDWLVRNWKFSSQLAYFVVYAVRKGMHFLGYGGIGLICWAYFFCWGLKKPLCFGIVLTALIAVADEYVQSQTTFRTGSAMDVMIDICGAVVVSMVVRIWIRNRTDLVEAKKDPLI